MANLDLERETELKIKNETTKAIAREKPESENQPGSWKRMFQRPKKIPKSATNFRASWLNR